jgi:hypothetical protein
MKKLLAVAAAGLVVIAASQLVTTVAASNQSGQASITRRVAALEKKVKVLQSQMKAVRADLACDRFVIGVSQVGNPAAGAGYVYTPDNGTTAYLAPALDLTPQGITPTAWVQEVDSSCVTSSPSHYKPAHAGSRMSRRAPFELRSTR